MIVPYKTVYEQVYISSWELGFGKFAHFEKIVYICGLRP